MYVITGATGNIGHNLSRALLTKGKKVRVIGRSAERLRPLVKLGAEAVVASVDDAAAMARAFAGATAVFTMSPPNLEEPDYRGFVNRVSEAFTDAIRVNNIRHVLNLSSLGAEAANCGLVNGHYDEEQRMLGLDGVNVLHLRPAYYMENVLWSIAGIREMGAIIHTLQEDKTLPMIATRDIAVVAEKYLLDLDFSGNSTVDILGHSNITMGDVTRAIGAAIGNPDLKYMQVPYQAAEGEMTKAGLSPDAARLMNELMQSINEGVYKATEARTATNTTPTSIDDFAAQVFAPIYNS